MKCIRCGHDSKYKDRPGRICPGCKRAFAFEPQEHDPVTDTLFFKAIRAISGDGSIRWGVEHLYYEICRRKRKWVPRPVIIALLLGLMVFLLTVVALTKTKGFPFLPILAIVSVVLTFIAIGRWLRGPFVPMDLTTFNELWSRWKEVHGKPAGVIERFEHPELPKDLEADIGEYSFDRAVICDRARTVDLLVANNFHFENNCAVLSIDGYPKGPFPIIRAMLKRNPKLQVFVLHDASLLGCRVAHRLITEPDWFGGTGLRVIDLGLRPGHAGPFRGLLKPGEGVRLNDDPAIRPDEAEWLSRYKLELAAVRPEQVLKRMFSGLTAHANDDPRSSGNGGSVAYCGAFDAGGYGGDGADGDSGGDGGGDGGGDAFG